MSTLNFPIENEIKYIAILDRTSTPLLFLNFDAPEKELDHQLQIFSTLEILEYKETESKSKEFYYGLLMPLYEYENDLGAYAYVGRDEIKLIMIKKLGCNELTISPLLKSIHIKYTSVVLNPFFDSSIFKEETKSNIKDKFVKDLIGLINNSKN